MTQSHQDKGGAGSEDTSLSGAAGKGPKGLRVREPATGGREGAVISTEDTLCPKDKGQGHWEELRMAGDTARMTFSVLRPPHPEMSRDKQCLRQRYLFLSKMLSKS